MKRICPQLTGTKNSDNHFQACFNHKYTTVFLLNYYSGPNQDDH
jgi:hypothetical protein